MLSSRYAPVVALAALGVVLVLLLGWFLAIKPQLSAADTASKQAAEVRANTELIEASSHKLDEYAALLAADETTAASIALNAPSRVDVAAFRDRVLRVVEASGVALVSINQLDGRALDGWEADPAALVSNQVANLFSTGPTVVVADGASSPGEAPTPTPAATAAPSAPAVDGGWAPVVVPITEPGPVAGDVRMVEVQFELVGTPSQIGQFMAALMDPEAQLFQVFSVTQTAGPSSDLLDGRTIGDTDIAATVVGALYVHGADLSIIDEEALGEARASDDAFSAVAAG